jgi:2'-5' RNA ligase
MRTFIAASVSPGIRERLIDLKRTLAAGAAEVRWVRDNGMHLTLEFFGATREELLPQIEGGLRGVAQRAAPFELHIRKLGAFPSPQRPRVVWIGAESSALERIVRGIEAFSAPLGFPSENRPFQGHITLGRIKGTRLSKSLRTAIEAGAGTDLGTCRVTELILFRSDLRPGGAVYTKLVAVPLGTPDS